MDLDEVDRALIRAVLEDAGRSLRELGELAGVSAPTVAARLDRLEALDILGPARREVDLTRLGTLALVTAPSTDRDPLVEHERVFRAWEAEDGAVVAMALLGDEDELEALEARFSDAEVTRLARQVHAVAPPFTREGVRTACDACGKPVEGDEAREVRLDEERLVACCPTCEAALLDAHDQANALPIDEASVPGPVTGPVSRSAPGVCDQCGSPIDEDDEIEVELGDRTYQVCCPGCRSALEARYERHEDAA